MTAGYGYAVSREDRRWYENRQRYIAAKSRADSPEICHVMEAAAERTSRLDAGGRSTWTGFPWLTFVLGSGAVAIADEPAMTSVVLGAKVREAVSEVVTAADGPGLGEQLGEAELDFASKAQLFTEALARDRLQESPKRPAGRDIEEVDWAIEPAAAELVLAAALLTSWFNRVRSAQHAPLSRWDDDEAVLDPARPLPSLSDLESAVLEPAMVIFNHLTKRLEARDTRARPKVAEAVTALLREISSNLQPGLGQPRRLRIEHLRLLTEVCWHFLLLETSVYPGWTDLLLGLMLQERRDDTNSAFRRARPLFNNLQSLPDYVKELITPATLRSWELSRPVETGSNALGTRDVMYRTLGEVLWCQAGLIAGRQVGANPAVAFVTSFDLEVEMGLWCSAPDAPLAAGGEAPTFNIVVPVHILADQDATEAEPCWLVGEVTPDPGLAWDDQLSALRSPARWRIMHDKMPTTFLPNRPTVVHLSGCPLFVLPVLSDDGDQADSLHRDLESANIDVDRHRADMVPAVTVDEYLALRQAEAEFFWSSTHQSDGEYRSGRGLPDVLTNDSDTNPRFWMALGVPIGDPAVRHRLVSQMTLRRVRHAGGGFDPAGGGLLGDQPGPAGVDPASFLGDGPAAAAAESGDRMMDRRDVDGVVVNRRVNDDEASLLYWLGLDVVRDDCLSFVQDLVHYVDHLRDPGPGRRTSPSGSCRVTRQVKGAA